MSTLIALALRRQSNRRWGGLYSAQDAKVYEDPRVRESDDPGISSDERAHAHKGRERRQGGSCGCGGWDKRGKETSTDEGQGRRNKVPRRRGRGATAREPVGLDAISLAQPLHNDGREMRQLRVPRRPFRHTLERMQNLCSRA